MKITVTFEDLAEFMRYVALDGKVTYRMERKPKEAPVEPSEAPEPVPAPEAKNEPQPEEKTETAPQDAPAEVSEDFRVEVRKVLAKLNKQAGGNKAKELVQKHGADKLTNVPLAELPALMKEAEEALKNA